MNWYRISDTKTKIRISQIRKRNTYLCKHLQILGVQPLRNCPDVSRVWPEEDRITILAMSYQLVSEGNETARTTRNVVMLR